MSGNDEWVNIALQLSRDHTSGSTAPEPATQPAAGEPGAPSAPPPTTYGYTWDDDYENQALEAALEASKATHEEERTKRSKPTPPPERAHVTPPTAQPRPLPAAQPRPPPTAQPRPPPTAQPQPYPMDDVGGNEDEALKQALEASEQAYQLEQRNKEIMKFFVDLPDEVCVELSVDESKISVLEGRCGCALRLDRTGLEVNGSSPEGMEKVKSYVQAAAANVLSLHQVHHDAQTTTVHIYVDISNIMFSRPRKDRELDVRSLREVIAGQREMGERWAFGSYKAGRPEPAWKKRWDAQFTTKLIKRLDKEESVDELVHAAVLKKLLHQIKKERKDVIVLVTGDGNANDKGATSFYDCVMESVDQDIPIEVWAWSAACSRAYKKLYNQGKITLRYLDSFEERLYVAPRAPTTRPVGFFS